MHETHSRLFRSTQWIEEGEKNSKYFLNLKKKNYTNRLITQLEVNGKILKEQTNIANAQHIFYKEQYSQQINDKNPEYDKSLKQFLENSNTKKLTPDEANFCEQPITEKEILSSLKIYTIKKHLEQMIFINFSGLILKTS